MSDWIKKLDQAKEMVAKGYMSEADFEELRHQALAELKSNQSIQTSNPRQPNRIGAYTLLKPIGKGGMGEVFLGFHSNQAIATRQGGKVAIKRMHSQYATDPAFRVRFDREASMGLKLQHPGIIKVHDLVEDSGELAIVMELAKGKVLSELIGSEFGPIPWEQTWPYFQKILDAVEFAHQQGVVHRDIKPENIIISQNGDVKVLDFGIAKEINQNKTKTGAGMGTVDYMAPEQYTNAKDVDSRADIYALGITLYEMLAGRLPWNQSCSEFEILKMKDEGNLPPPTQFYPHIPTHVISEIERATSRQINQRHASVKAFAAALEAVETKRFHAPPPVRVEEEKRSDETEDWFMDGQFTPSTRVEEGKSVHFFNILAYLPVLIGLALSFTIYQLIASVDETELQPSNKTNTQTQSVNSRPEPFTNAQDKPKSKMKKKKRGAKSKRKGRKAKTVIKSIRLKKGANKKANSPKNQKAVHSHETQPSPYTTPVVKTKSKPIAEKKTLEPKTAKQPDSIPKRKAVKAKPKEKQKNDNKVKLKWGSHEEESTKSIWGNTD